MKRALINLHKCANCQPCPSLEGCEMKAIFREMPTDKPWVDFYKCGGCLLCKGRCPLSAIEEMMQPCDGKGRMGW